MTTPNPDTGNFDLEYQDSVTNPSDPTMQGIEKEIPERYKGKTVDDLINMHVNLEKVLHRQGNELGQARRTIDLQSQTLANAIPRNNPSTQPQERPPLTAETLLGDPQKALETAVQPLAQATAQRLDSIERKLSQTDFESKHPNFVQDVQNPEFQNWVTGSRTRQKLLQALNQYDFDSGNDLWELWNEHRAAKSAVTQSVADKTRAAATIKGSSAEATPGKVIYSRAKLAELQVKAMAGDPGAQARWNDPEFQREYLAAYSEGRVK